MASVIEKIGYPYVEKKKGVCGGNPVIKNTRIRIIDIAIEYTLLEYTPDDIINAHPFLTLAQVHDALSYYYDHQEEINNEIMLREKSVERLQEELNQ